jgi:PAS domain S-box-containing protein
MAIRELPALHSATDASPLLVNQSAHSVQFYFNDSILVDELARFIGTALVCGDAAIVIATGPHREALARELKARDLDATRALAEGRFVCLDAAQTLVRIMRDQMPDPELFSEIVGDLITQARAATKSEQSAVVIFGEMVATLWAQEKREAAVRLEELWNALAKKYSFSLRCAYPMDSFYQREHSELFGKICGEHAAVLPLGSRTLVFNDEERLRTIAGLQQRLEVLEYESNIRETERRFRMLVEAVQDYAIFTLDAEGHVNSWNIGAERLKGYKADEILGRHFSAFYPPEDIADGKPQRELSIAIQEGRVEDEGWRLRKDGSRFWANVVITATKDALGGVIGFSKVTRDFTERMQVQKELRDSQQKLLESEKSLRELSFHLLRTQDEERRRIGRDLHDSLGQYLSVLKMKLDFLRSAPEGRRPEDVEELNHCAQITEDAVKEVRTISYLLYPPMLEEMGLNSAISWYLDGFTKRSNIQTTFEVSPNLARLDPDVELAIFRVLQESLTNVHRHSGSTTASVRLSLDDDTFVMEISDQGKGAYSDTRLGGSAQDGVSGHGVGLRGMRERMRQVGGKLHFGSSPKGTVVTATVPIKKSPPACATP